MTLLKGPPTSESDHSKGLFHDAVPQHTHRQCHNCHKMARFNRGRHSQLRRCRGCFLEQYCSAQCQKTAWDKGHRDICEIYSDVRKYATELSGDAHAWENLMTWVRYHHSSIMNATLACCLREREREHHAGSSFFEVAANHFLLLSVAYRNDPALPEGQQFEVQTVEYARLDDARLEPLCDIVQAGREGAVRMGKKEYGRSYAGTGSYLVVACFGSEARGCGGRLPFAKHFGIDDTHARARPACRDPLDQLKENLSLGKKMRYCCGRSPRHDRCCCGGWTHKLMQLEAETRSMQISDEVD